MITRLKLENFKNFKDTTLSLGNFSLLVGTNASGKSNLRDAFRFMHGVARGYSLAEIIGEKWGEGGVLQWKGLRGGLREVAFAGNQEFSLEVSVTASPLTRAQSDENYRLTVLALRSGGRPLVLSESFYSCGTMIFDSHPKDIPFEQKDPKRFLWHQFSANSTVDNLAYKIASNPEQPSLTQLAFNQVIHPDVNHKIMDAINNLGGMRFMDFFPDAMRVPSVPGQIVLGDRGENLSSVLQAICEVPNKKQAVMEWVRELTPLDVVDFEFMPDAAGRVLVILVESSGLKTSAYSASDGTLRFLAIIGALLGDNPAKFYFFEEIENGIHPTRLHLLLQLIEQQTADGTIQVVATTHSPQLLTFLSDESLEHTSLVYRLEGRPDAHIKRILDIPEAKRVLEEQDLARLHSTGWLEDAVAFTEEAPQP